MALGCTDSSPDHPVSVEVPRPRILHISKVPPSSSGVARHSGAFSRALATVGTVRTIGIGVSAADTQRVRVIVRLALRVIRDMSRFRPSLVVVELSGRGLAEFYCACVAVIVGRGCPLWLVVHDAPELVGPPMLVRGLDRRGGRRVAMAMSRRLGARVEGWLVRRADTLFALSDLGASALRDNLGEGVHIRGLPLAIEGAAPAPKESVVYCPSSMMPAEVEPVLHAVASDTGAWRLRVGHLPEAERRVIEGWAAQLGVGERIDFLDYVDQAALDASYADAAVVVRNRTTTYGAANWAAASGPVVSAMAAGCAVIATDPRGSAACLRAAGGVDLSSSPEDLVSQVHRLLSDQGERGRLGEAGRRHVDECHTPEQVAPHLAAAWTDTRSRRRER